MEYFILGMLFVQVMFPVLDGLTSLLLTMIETAKGYFGLKVAEYNVKMRQSTILAEDTRPMAAIGFAVDYDEEEEEEENES